MGEKVWYKRLRAGKSQNKAETEWFERVWLGPATGSSETLIGTSEGVVRASSVKRHDQSQQPDQQGSPQQPDPSKPGLHIAVRI